MWPFSKKPPPVDTKLVFKGSSEFFEYQCQFGQTTITPKQAIIAMVLDGKEFGLPEAVQVLPDGSQQALIKVASVDGGFLVASMTPTGGGDRLKPGDIVMWVPVEHAEEGKKPRALFPRTGWIGFIVAKVKPEIDLAKQGFDIVCYYKKP